MCSGGHVERTNWNLFIACVTDMLQPDTITGNLRSLA